MRWYEDLSLCVEDEDWFKLGSLDAGDGLEVDLRFSHDLGDIDVMLFPEGFEASTDYIASGFSRDDDELIRINVMDAGSYLLKVFNRSEPNLYDLHLHREPGGYTLPLDLCETAGTIAIGDTIQGTTSGLMDHYAGSCSFSRGPEAVYALTVLIPKTVKIRVESEFDAACYLRLNQCDDANTEAVCKDDSWDPVEEFEVLLATGVYYLFVDGYSPVSEGEFTLSVQEAR